MKNIIISIFLLILFSAASCSSAKIHQKKTYVSDLAAKNRLYGIDRNPYFYFMIDSTETTYLVKTHSFNSAKVIWVEKLVRIRK